MSASNRFLDCDADVHPLAPSVLQDFVQSMAVKP